jgi:hypothetical protein
MPEKAVKPVMYSLIDPETYDIKGSWVEYVFEIWDSFKRQSPSVTPKPIPKSFLKVSSYLQTVKYEKKLHPVRLRGVKLRLKVKIFLHFIVI